MTIQIDEDDLLTAVRAATGRDDAHLGHWRVEPSPHRVENMTTDSLDRVVGVLADGTPWSLFVKVLHPASASPVWPLIPEEHRGSVLEDLHWLDEPRIYRCGLADGLPDGVRMPHLHHVSEGPERIALWLEDVVDAGPWDLGRYHRAAVALGRLSGRWPGTSATDALGIGPRPMARLFFGKIMNVDVPAHAEDAFWADPAVGAAVDDHHRADLERLRDVMPMLLGRLDRLPHGLAHGDATPHNLLEPGDATVVTIDWSYASCAALGSDLGQLLAGRVETGEVDPAQLGALGATIVDGYLEGLASEGSTADRSSVEEAWATNLAVRSVFSALLLDHRPDLEGDERQALLERRAVLGRFGLDLVERVMSQT